MDNKNGTYSSSVTPHDTVGLGEYSDNQLMAEVRKRGLLKKGSMMYRLCDECDGFLPEDTVSPYKYEPERWVCMDCHDLLMDDPRWE